MRIKNHEEEGEREKEGGKGSLIEVRKIIHKKENEKYKIENRIKSEIVPTNKWKK